MESEQLKIFDEQYNVIGITSREDVHKYGYWHETFHCWFIDEQYIYLQKRSGNKKDYPNLLDITAAGHLLAEEEIMDGIREIKEELGIEISFDQLKSLGVISYSVQHKQLIDNEFANVFFYVFSGDLDSFQLQHDEVSGIVKINIKDFIELWRGTKEEVIAQGFEMQGDGMRKPIYELVGKDAFVWHNDAYYQAIINGIVERIVD